MKTRIRSLRLEKLEDRQLLDGAGLGLDVGPPEHHPVGPPEVTPPDDVPVLVAPPVDVPEPEGGPDTIDHDSHGGFTGGTVIPQGETLTVIGPHHADGAGHDSHFFAETGDDHHFVWADQDDSTSDVIDILYDFRDLGGRWGKNEITGDIADTNGQKAMAIAAMKAWTDASGGKINFIRDTVASSSEIIIIGTGNLRALGYRSAPNGILGLGGGTYTHNTDHTITSGVAWMDSEENWDEARNNGNPSGTIDYFTVVAQEIGHALGLGHVSGPHIMNGSYTGPVEVYSTTDDSHIQAVYGDGAPSEPEEIPPVISDVAPSNITSTSVTITWTTDEPATSIVEYGTDSFYGSSVSDTALVTSHSITLTDLTAENTYYYNVTSADVWDNEAFSVDATFDTVATPTVATQVSVVSITYATSGGKNGDKNLLITPTANDNLGDLKSGATVSIRLTNSGSGGPWTGSATTGTDGTVTFKLRNAPDGTYSTEITGVVTADGLTWVGGTPVNEFIKGASPSSSNADSLLLSGSSSLALGIDAAPLFGADDHPTGPTDTPADPPAAENRREDPRARARVAIRAGRAEWTAVARRVAGRSQAVDDLFEGLGEDSTDPGLTLSLGIDL